MLQPMKYPLPPFLQGIVTQSKYCKWLHCKADTLRRRDLRMNRPYAKANSVAVYKALIHEAISQNGEVDPYTGDSLHWDLIGFWDNKPIPKRALVPISGLSTLFAKIIYKVNLSHASMGLDKKYGFLPHEYYLMPTIDHCEPESEILRFEVCSWIVNAGKNQLTPQEYIALCQKVVGHIAGEG